jgi:hypothetical protein
VNKRHAVRCKLAWVFNHRRTTDRTMNNRLPIYHSLERLLHPAAGFACGPFLEEPDVNDLSPQARTKRKVLRAAEAQIAYAKRPPDLLERNCPPPFEESLFDEVERTIECVAEQKDWFHCLHETEALALSYIRAA